MKTSMNSKMKIFLKSEILKIVEKNYFLKIIQIWISHLGIFKDWQDWYTYIYETFKLEAIGRNLETLPIFLFPKLNSYKFAKFLCLKKFLYISVRMLIWAYLEVFEFAEFESGIVLNISISIIGCYLI